VVALAILGSAATITIAWSLSYLISQVFIEHASIESVQFCFGLIALGGLLKALVIWLQELFSTRAAAAVKLELRQKFFEAVNKLGPSWLAKRSISEVNLLGTTGLDALEPYFAKYLPQLVYTGIVTPVFLAIIWISDFSSGLTVLVTLPLIPVFMILIGWATKTVQQRQLDSLTALSQHFLEVLRGLTTLKVFGRVDAQTETMNRVSRQHRERTMKVLRVTFLSGFALELIASLAVALIAVSIGLRLLTGDISLMVGLFVLLLAPEAYLPIRQVGAQFHASAEGVAASGGVLGIIDEARRFEPEAPAGEIQYFVAGRLTVLTGPSGAGKSTVFRRVLGFDGQQPELSIDQCAWLPQKASLFAGSIAFNIVGPSMGGIDAQYDSKLVKQAMNLAALDDLGANYEVGVEGSRVSGGQAQRICLARFFYRALTLDTKYLLVDEPISALDESRAQTVINSLLSFAADGKTVVAISHQISLIQSAHHVVEIDAAPQVNQVAESAQDTGVPRVGEAKNV
jgi:ATP-binding cassette subfamily C protein CydD